LETRKFTMKINQILHKQIPYFALGILLLASLACGTSTGGTVPTVDPGSVQTAIVQTVAAAELQTSAPSIPTNTEASQNPEPTSTPPPTQNPNLIKPGTYLVGVDIKAGIYRGEAGAGVFSSCYWERLKDLSGSFDSILANDNSVGQFYVEVVGTDYAINTHCDLVPIESLPANTGEFPQVIEPGTYIVGRDIQAGTYRGEAGSDITASCYWERVSSVAGGFDPIIANDNAIGQFYVQVAGSDFALKTACKLERVGD
jgi:hypothetical protein